MNSKSSLSRYSILGLIFIGPAIAWSADIDCSKYQPSLCTSLQNATSDSASFSVSIIFKYPESAPECKEIDPKTDTSGKCAASGWDSAYYAKLKADAKILFEKFELWDYYNPTKRILPPSEGKVGYQGIVATKATIISVSTESYVSVVETWKHFGPARIDQRKGESFQGHRVRAPQEYLINGEKAFMNLIQRNRSKIISR